MRLKLIHNILQGNHFHSFFDVTYVRAWQTIFSSMVRAAFNNVFAEGRRLLEVIRVYTSHGRSSIRSCARKFLCYNVRIQRSSRSPT